MVRKHFSQKQKLSILRSAEQTTIKDAASIAEVHFTTVYDWKKQFEVMGEQGFLEHLLLEGIFILLGCSG